MRKLCQVLKKASILTIAALVCNTMPLAAQSKPHSIFKILDVPFSSVGVAAISATSANNVWAISELGQGTTNVSFNFNGTSWNELSLAASIDFPAGVAAISSGDVWVVGSNLNVGNGVRSEIVENFDGKQWVEVKDVDLIGKVFKIHGVPFGTVTQEALTSISAVSASSIYAGGFVVTDSIIAPFVEHWNGKKWSLTPSVGNGQDLFAFLQGIAALSDTDVWAVGYDDINGGAGVALSWHFDGTKWTQVKGAPNCYCAFETVAAIASNDIWAGGYLEFPKAGFLTEPMAQHWDGKSWTLAPAPPNPDIYPYTGNSGLNQLAAVSSTNVWAISSLTDPYTFYEKAVVQHWDGSKWNLELLPFCPSQECGLLGVVALSTGQVWAAGGSSNIDEPQNPFVLFTDQDK
jgi:hypothetical protein